MKLLVPFGTRPEIIKLAPVIAAVLAAGFDTRVVATGQQADPSMSDEMTRALGVVPADTWELPADGSERFGAILTRADREIATTRPDVVLLLGDTLTVPAFSLAARRHGVPVAHLEAGMRSFNETSMEELNRRVAAAAASLHLAPTERAASFLLREGIEADRIRVVGNPVIDALRSRGVKRTPIEDRAGVVVTAHRATNVDIPERLADLVALIARLQREIGPVTFPVHPRTAQRMADSGADTVLAEAGVTLLMPLGYDAMLDLVGRAQVVVTDSGGLQEEAAWLGVPVVVLRRSTPRWESVDAGLAVLAGLDAELAVDACRRFVARDEQERVAATACPYGDGHTADRVVELLSDPAVVDLLRLREPDFTGGALPE